MIVNGLRLRHRLRSLAVLRTGGDPAPGRDDVVVVHVDGGGPDAATVAAADHLGARDLEAVDLVPADLPVEELLDHLRISDPHRLRANPIFVGFGAGQAVVMTRRLAERSGVTGGAADTVDVRRAFAQAKRYAPHGVDQVVAPGLVAVPLTVDQNLAVWRAQYGRPLPLVATTRLGPVVAAGAALAAGARVAGAAPAAVAAALQPTIVTAGTDACPRDLWSPGVGVGRLVGVPLRLARSVRGRWRPAHPAHTDPRFIDEERSRVYADDLARGVARLLGPERDDCPICASRDIRVWLRAPEVSMFHYLEHTTDPLAELDAARRVLEPGGHLVIEVPAPDCRPASWYGWAWGPWMQPQHLNLLPLDTMVDQLERRGFEVLHTDRRQPRQPWDTSWAAFQVLTRVAPGPNAPWTVPRSRAHRAARLAALGAGTPLMVAAMLADRLVIDPLIRVDPRLSNVYWLVARTAG